MVEIKEVMRTERITTDDYNGCKREKGGRTLQRKGGLGDRFGQWLQMKRRRRCGIDINEYVLKKFSLNYTYSFGKIKLYCFEEVLLSKYWTIKYRLKPTHIYNHPQ